MTGAPLNEASDCASADRPVWPLAALQQALTAHLPGGIVEVLERIDSTNTELMRRARDGHSAPTLLVAEQQTAGRGRLGRQWLSSPGDSLTFSLGLPLAPRDWSGLSLAVGLSVAESLQPVPPASDSPQGLRLGLKWPNDLWLTDDRKLGGILTETASFVLPGAGTGFAAGRSTSASTSARYVVIGIGINIRPRDAQGLATPPACLQDIAPGACRALGVESENAPQRDQFLPDSPPHSGAMGQEDGKKWAAAAHSQPTIPKPDRLLDMDAPTALLRLLAPLLGSVQAFAAHGFAPLRARYAARDLLAGREVLLSDGTSGVAQGVGADGALQVQTRAGLRAITSAEVSVRPRARAAGEAAVAGTKAGAAAVVGDAICVAAADQPAAPPFMAK